MKEKIYKKDDFKVFKIVNNIKPQFSYNMINMTTMTKHSEATQKNNYANFANEFSCGKNTLVKNSSCNYQNNDGDDKNDWAKDLPEW